jgi:hypothetical protein
LSGKEKKDRDNEAGSREDTEASEAKFAGTRIQTSTFKLKRPQ